MNDTPDRFAALMDERARAVAWRAAAQSPHRDTTAIAEAVERMERGWLDHLARGGDPGIETARRLFPGPWFALWCACR